MAKGNRVSAIKKYFATKTTSLEPIPIRSADEMGTGRGELMELGAADKSFYRELGEFCVAECDRLGIEY